MAAAALPIALVFGIVADLVSGLVTWPLGGEKNWWRRLTGTGTDVTSLVRDRKGRERASVLDGGGAAAAMLGSGMAAAGALGIGPDDLPLLYLGLAVAAAGSVLVGLSDAEGERIAGRQLLVVLAEPAFAVGLGAMFLRYGALDLEAVRGTQQVLGTGLLLAPGLAAAGLALAALAYSASGALRLPPPAGVDRRGNRLASGPALLSRLCRWSLAGASSLVAGVLLAGGGMESLTPAEMLPAAVGSLGAAVAIGVADAFLRRLSPTWAMAATGISLVAAAGGAAMVVLA